MSIFVLFALQVLFKLRTEKFFCSSRKGDISFTRANEATKHLLAIGSMLTGHRKADARMDGVTLVQVFRANVIASME